MEERHIRPPGGACPDGRAGRLFHAMIDDQLQLTVPPLPLPFPASSPHPPESSDPKLPDQPPQLRSVPFPEPELPDQPSAAPRHAHPTKHDLAKNEHATHHHAKHDSISNAPREGSVPRR